MYSHSLKSNTPQTTPALCFPCVSLFGCIQNMSTPSNSGGVPPLTPPDTPLVSRPARRKANKVAKQQAQIEANAAAAIGNRPQAASLASTDSYATAEGNDPRSLLQHRQYGSKLSKDDFQIGTVISFPHYGLNYNNPPRGKLTDEDTLSMKGHWFRSKIRKFIVLVVYNHHCESPSLCIDVSDGFDDALLKISNIRLSFLGTEMMMLE
jgi:hypothetical protein